LHLKVSPINLLIIVKKFQEEEKLQKGKGKEKRKRKK